MLEEFTISNENELEKRQSPDEGSSLTVGEDKYPICHSSRSEHHSIDPTLPEDYFLNQPAMGESYQPEELQTFSEARNHSVEPSDESSTAAFVLQEDSFLTASRHIGSLNAAHPSCKIDLASTKRFDAPPKSPSLPLEMSLAEVVSAYSVHDEEENISRIFENTSKLGDRCNLLPYDLDEVMAEHIEHSESLLSESFESLPGAEEDNIDSTSRLYSELDVRRGEGLVLLPRLKQAKLPLKISLFGSAYAEPEGPRIEFFRF